MARGDIGRKPNLRTSVSVFVTAATDNTGCGWTSILWRYPLFYIRYDCGQSIMASMHDCSVVIQSSKYHRKHCSFVWVVGTSVGRDQL